MVACVKQALVGWKDQDDPPPGVLGSLSPFLLVDLDEALGVFMLLSLRVSIKVAGVPDICYWQTRHPPFTTPASPLEGRALRTHFVFSEPGYAVLPNTNAESIVPKNSTAASILAAVHSLSTATQFEVYMKPSDYTRVGLNRFAPHLQNVALKPLALWDVFDDDVQPLDWNCVELFAAHHHEHSSH